MASARSALLLVLASLSSIAVACSAAPDSSKKPLPICDANDPECPGVPASSNKTHTDVPSDPVTVPEHTPAAEPTPSSPSPEAGADAAPVMGMFCKQLAQCCDDLKSAGYDTTICKSVLSTNDEDACYTKHASYKDDGDCL